jgi:hypothetical protein
VTSYADPRFEDHLDERPRQSNLGTLRQFAEWRCATFCAENPQISKAEYRRNYPVESFHREWVAAVFAEARRGAILSRHVLDCLFRLEPKGRLFWALFHDWPGCLPDGYLNPGVRHQEKWP